MGTLGFWSIVHPDWVIPATVVGKCGSPGKRLKQFGAVHEIDCREPNTLYVAELSNWRVQKLSLLSK